MPGSHLVCLGVSTASQVQVEAACSVAGVWLVTMSILGSFFTLVTLFYINRRTRPIERGASFLDACARNCYICGILHVCVSLCYWMILSRTSYKFIVPPFMVGFMWVWAGIKYTKWSDRVHERERASQLLVNLLNTTNNDDEDSINAPSGLFVTGPEEGYRRYSEKSNDVEAPPLPGDGDSSEELRVAHGQQVSDISDDDLESFDGDEMEEDGEEGQSMPYDHIPVAEEPVLVEEEETQSSGSEDDERC